MKKILIIFFIFFTFVLIRFIDLTIIWNISKTGFDHLLKTEEWDSKKKCYYVFLGFRGFKSTKAELLYLAKERKEKVIIVGYYNLISPSIFLIYNKDSLEKIYLPWDVVKASKDITEVTFYKCDLAKIKSAHDTEYKAVPIIGNILPKLKYLFGEYLEMISWEIDSSMYIHWIYMFYFIFPLILILMFSYVWSKSIFVSFLYFFIMPILFSTKTYWEYPIVSIFRIFYGYSDINPTLLLLFLLISNICVYILFFLGIKKGIRVIREKGVTYNEKIVIWLILSLILFFRL